MAVLWRRSRRRYELVLPVEGGTEEVAALLSWREGSPSWRGPSPKACLEQHCTDNKVNAQHAGV